MVADSDPGALKVMCFVEDERVPEIESREREYLH
jgi:hypothetical protein